MRRPEIEEIDNAEELKKWYWLKQELVDFCKCAAISYKGGKFDIIERIALHLEQATPSVQIGLIGIKPKPYKWSKKLLTPGTLITTDYTNGPNTREFFKEHCGMQFHFSISFMDWMKNNAGKTLKEAVTKWNSLHEQEKVRGFESVIPKHNQYNQYIRDFFADNPDKNWAVARAAWKLKRALPLGLHTYSRTDLDLLNKQNK